MKRALIALLLCFAAQPAHADKVWVLWCKTPSGEDLRRQAKYDTSAECWKDIDTGQDTDCHDTPKGPRLGETYERVESWEHQHLRDCAAVKKVWASCHCEPETVQ